MSERDLEGRGVWLVVQYEDIIRRRLCDAMEREIAIRKRAANGFNWEVALDLVAVEHEQERLKKELGL